jgi:hypothetical protein
MVCGEELPAQWQKLPLKTQNEMRAGRNALGDAGVEAALRRWADDGEKFLRDNIPNPKGDIEYHTKWSVEDKTITLEVYRMVQTGSHGGPIYVSTLLMEVTEKAENFVSHLTVTKILMIV